MRRANAKRKNQLLDAIRRLVKVQRQMRLALMMRFVPGEYLDPLHVGPWRLLGRLRQQRFLVELLQERDHFLALGLQVSLDRIEPRDVVVRRAAAGETANELGVCGLAAGRAHADMSVAVIGGGDVHDLPGEVSPARPRSEEHTSELQSR